MVLIISDQVTSYMSAQRFTFNHFWNLAKKWSLLLWQDAHSLFLLFLSSRFSASQIQGGIGRMILKEEMKARSGSYDNDPWAARGTPAVGAGRCCTAWATTTQLTAVSAPLEMLYNGRLQRCVFGGGCCRVIKNRTLHIALVTAFEPSKPNLLFVFV